MSLANQTATLRQTGARTWWQVKVAPVLQRMCGHKGPSRFSLPGFRQQEMFLRPDTSDLYVFHQIFVEREYAPFDDLAEPDFILDCGANVGYSAAYFLTRFPRCFVVAVEPDPGNFQMLQRNLAAFGARARVIQAGVWSHPAHLKISRSHYRDGLQWSTQVTECRPGEAAEIRAVDVGTLLAESGRERISLLKMDIEGAEAVVFADGAASWISRVDNLAIEVHDDTSFGPASEVVGAVLAREGFAVSRAGDLTFCRRVR